MQKKIIEFCTSFPKPCVQQSPLDNLAANVFHHTNSMSYIQSKSLPEGRYGIRINKKFNQKHINYYVPNFSDYGPNEKFLINKILYSPSALLVIVGGIGVGKTRFSDYFMNTVIFDIISNYKEIPQNPHTIYFNFLDDGNTIPTEGYTTNIQNYFIDRFCDRINAEFNGLFDLEFELGTIWDDLIKKYINSQYKHSAISYILSEVRTRNADHNALAENYDKTIEIRNSIRNSIISDPGKRISYTAEILKYSREKFYNNNPIGLLLIIDNLDRETSLIQQIVINQIKPFARIAGPRIILNARQSTYKQQFGEDGSSDPIDIVPFCGTSPIDVVNARIDYLIKNQVDFSEYYDEKSLPFLCQGIEAIRLLLFTNETLLKLFQSFCGRSVRKGLTLAQRLIHNSVFDPSLIINPDNNEICIKKRDLIRALIVGCEPFYQNSYQNIVDNIFEVEPFYGSSYLLKTRLLLIISTAGDYGRSINIINYALGLFGYSQEMILNAVNELKNEEKRLIWSDAQRLPFSSEAELASYANSHLFLSSAGKGYIESIILNLDYIQEVMVSTSIDDMNLGAGWHYEFIRDRISLLVHFLSIIYEIDIDEMERFLGSVGPKKYFEWFNNDRLFSEEVMQKSRDSIDNVLSATINDIMDATRKNEMIEFHRDIMDKLNYYIYNLSNFAKDKLRNRP